MKLIKYWKSHNQHEGYRHLGLIEIGDKCIGIIDDNHEVTGVKFEEGTTKQDIVEAWRHFNFGALNFPRNQNGAVETAAVIDDLERGNWIDMTTETWGDTTYEEEDND